MNKRVITLFLSACLISSCGTKISIVSVKDESLVSSGISSIVVTAPYDDLEVRQSLVLLVVAAARSKGYRAVSSITMLPPLRSYTPEEVGRILDNHDLDAILVVGVTDFWKTTYSTPSTYVTETESHMNASVTSHINS